jgi:hypothetical protein
MQTHTTRNDVEDPSLQQNVVSSIRNEQAFKVQYSKQGDVSKRLELAGCCDTGAPVTVCGSAVARKICLELDIPFVLKPSQNKFRFADSVFPSLGKIDIHLPTPAGLIIFSVEIISADVPLLLGLDFFDKIQATPNVVANRLESKSWNLPLERHHGHIYLHWPVLGTMLTQLEPKKHHRAFYHPSTEKLYNLLRRAKPQETSATREILDQITQACDTCQRFFRRQLSFSVGSADSADIVFNRKICLDIMFLSNARNT